MDGFAYAQDPTYVGRASGIHKGAAPSCSLLFTGCSELLDRAPRPIVGAIGSHRANRVVIGCTRLKVGHPHAENCRWVVWVKPDGRFCSLAEVLGIRTIPHDAVMHGRASGVVACPPYDSQMLLSQFDLWPFGDPDVRALWSRWTWLSNHRI